MQEFRRIYFLAVSWGASHRRKLEEKESYNPNYTENNQSFPNNASRLILQCQEARQTNQVESLVSAASIFTVHKVFEIGGAIWLCNFQVCESHFGKIGVKTTLLPSLTEEGAGTAGWWASTMSVTAFEELQGGECLSLSFF